ncbi:hypothetical protein D3C80_1964360 [compost metagenome]
MIAHQKGLMPELFSCTGIGAVCSAAWAEGIIAGAGDGWICGASTAGAVVICWTWVCNADIC